MAKGYRVTLVIAEPSPSRIEPEQVNPGRRVGAILRVNLKHSDLDWYLEDEGELIEFSEPE